MPRDSVVQREKVSKAPKEGATAENWDGIDSCYIWPGQSQYLVSVSEGGPRSHPYQVSATEHTWQNLNFCLGHQYFDRFEGGAGSRFERAGKSG